MNNPSREHKLVAASSRVRAPSRATPGTCAGRREIRFEADVWCAAICQASTMRRRGRTGRWPTLWVLACACSALGPEGQLAEAPREPLTPPIPSEASPDVVGGARLPEAAKPAVVERAARAPDPGIGQAEIPSGCPEPLEAVVVEPNGPKGEYSTHGYRRRRIQLARADSQGEPPHCIDLEWPAGASNSRGDRVGVAELIHPGWWRAIENTLARVPLAHARVLRRVVIDNRPREHGIAAFDRQDPDDGRDGHTIWLHEHLFRDPNHWARGNYGSYWAYHVDRDGKTLHAAPEDHDLFSPVLLHELAHLVMYNIANAGERGVMATGTPPCARTCADAGTCQRLPRRAREDGCISAYCMPFRFQAGTENFAEQYRFYYQGQHTRDLLVQAGFGCADYFAELEAGASASAGAALLEAPWQRGLPQAAKFRPSLWDSCGGRACKPF